MAAVAGPSTSAACASDATALVRGATAALIASTLSKTVVAPLDRVKLVIQLEAASTSGERVGAVACARRLLVEGGARSLFRGNLASVLRVFPNNALNFALRDRYRSFFVGDATARRQRTRFVLGEQLKAAAPC